MVALQDPFGTRSHVQVSTSSAASASPSQSGMDVFAGLDGLDHSKSQKLSLAEQQQANEQKAQALASAFDDLNLLPPPLAPAVSTTFGAQTVTATNSSNPDDDDIFGIFSAPAVAATPPPPPNVAAKPAVVASPPVRSPPPASRASSVSRTSSFGSERATLARTTLRAGPSGSPRDLDDLPQFGGPNRRQRQSSAYATDKNISAMVEMGFEPVDATRALEAMHGSVHGAVNWLMAEAQGLPLPKPRASAAAVDFGELQQSANQFGASMFSKASKLFAKGRREIEKMYADYSNAATADAENPAWMKQRAGTNGRPRPQHPAEAIPQPTLPTRPERSSDRINRTDRPDVIDRPDRASTASPRPSRAEAFRQRQMQRTAGQSPDLARAQTPEFPARAQTPQSVRAASSTPLQPARPSQPAPPAAQPAASEVDQVDLLNLAAAPATSDLSATQGDLFTAARTEAAVAYTNGSYEAAVANYSAALDVLPPGHALRIVMLANRAAAHLKNGDARASFDDSGAALQQVPNCGRDMQIDGKPAQPLWQKLVARRAQAAEQLEKFDDAIQAWQLLLDNGFASPAVLDAKRRCLRARDMHAGKTAPAEPQKPRTQRRGWGTSGAQPTSAEGKAAVAKVKDLHAQQQRDEQEREQFRESVAARIDVWKRGNETNLRALLASLHTVLWEGCPWEPVPSSELVVPKKVRVVYMKAVARTHPDKIPASASTEVKMTAQAVFIAVQDAWEVFRQESGL